MKGCKRSLRSAVGALALLIAGASSASGFTIAYQTSPLSVYGDSLLRGQGAGSFTRVSTSSARLSTSLRDVRVDGTRTFMDAKGYAAGGKYFGVQSGRRSDGGSTWATMATKYGYSGGVMSGYTGYAKTCQDRPSAPDWCSTEVKGAL